MNSIAENTTMSAHNVCWHSWTDMWNRLVPAAEVVTADCRVYFGRKPQIPCATVTAGAQELQSVIDMIREHRPGIRYRVDSQPLYQANSNTSGIITLLWNVAVPGEGTRTGIDLLRHDGVQITEVWSITGDLELPVVR